MVNYVSYNAYTSEYINGSDENVRYERFYYYEISNNLMETRVEFSGVARDKMFIKHAVVIDYTINIQNYYASLFDQTKNTVSIIRPILGESFMVTVLVGEKRAFDLFNLCTFAERKQDEKFAPYEITFPSTWSNPILHYIDFRSFDYNVGKQFDLLVYAVHLNFYTELYPEK